MLGHTPLVIYSVAKWAILNNVVKLLNSAVVISKLCRYAIFEESKGLRIFHYV